MKRCNTPLIFECRPTKECRVPHDAAPQTVNKSENNNNNNNNNLQLWWHLCAQAVDKSSTFHSNFIARQTLTISMQLNQIYFESKDATNELWLWCKSIKLFCKMLTEPKLLWKWFRRNHLLNAYFAYQKCSREKFWFFFLLS